MIRVTVELVPFGFLKPRVLGVAEIANDGTGTGQRGNYTYRLTTRDGRTTYKEGEIRDFPRRRYLAWDLLFRVLRDASGERNGCECTNG